MKVKRYIDWKQIICHIISTFLLLFVEGGICADPERDLRVLRGQDEAEIHSRHVGQLVQ